MKELSPVDKAILWNRERLLTPDELKGFGPAKRKPPKTVPVVKVLTPSSEDGPRGYGVFIGIKGTF